MQTCRDAPPQRRKTMPRRPWMYSNRCSVALLHLLWHRFLHGSGDALDNNRLWQRPNVVRCTLQSTVSHALLAAVQSSPSHVLMDLAFKGHYFPRHWQCVYAKHVKKSIIQVTAGLAGVTQDGTAGSARDTCKAEAPRPTVCLAGVSQGGIGGFTCDGRSRARRRRGRRPCRGGRPALGGRGAAPAPA